MQKNKFLRNKIKQWIKKNNIIDAVLFGSFVRNKDKPRDIDICLIIPDNSEKDSIEILESFKKTIKEEKIHASIITEKDFIKGQNTLVKTLLSEGISVIKDEPLSKLFGFENKTIFMYSLKGSKPTKRVKFHYVMRGRRGSKGILDEVNGNLLGDGIIIIPTEEEDVMKEVFDRWSIKFKIKRVLFG